MKFPRYLISALVLSAITLFAFSAAEAKKRSRHPSRHPRPAPEVKETFSGVRLKLVDGSFLVVDEASESQQGIWYSRGGISHLIARDRVKAIERGSSSATTTAATLAKPEVNEDADDQDEAATAPAHVETGPVWIHLKGGARFEVDSVAESIAGAWYRRGPLAVFVDRSRIDHIERTELNALADNESSKKARGWTTGKATLDGLIKQSGAKYGVDPYLIFCVMEQESHFNSRALSPKGARGLMQLMPGTAARLGVKRPSDPAQNIAGGTRYLKLLLNQFHGRIDLVLASYNAGEGAVMKYGNRVPPYRETRDYVKRISYRYGRAKSRPAPKSEVARVGAGL